MSLTHYWKFNNNVLDSEGAYNLTANGGATYSPGKLVYAIQWDGTAGSAAYANTAGIITSVGWTVCGWVKHRSAGGGAPGFKIAGGVDVNDTGGVSFAVSYFSGPGSSVWRLSDPDAGNFPAFPIVSSNITDDVWYFVYIRCDIVAEGIPRFHAAINMGTEYQSAAETGATNFTSIYIYDSVDDLRVYNTKLTLTDLNAIYNSGSPVEATPPTTVSVPTVARSLLIKTSSKPHDFRSRLLATTAKQHGVYGRSLKTINKSHNVFKLISDIYTYTISISTNAFLKASIQDSHGALAVNLDDFQLPYSAEYLLSLMTYGVRDQSTFSVGQASQIRLSNLTGVIRETYNKQISTLMRLYTARDHMTQANLYLPNYADTDNLFPEFINSNRARYTSPRNLPTVAIAKSQIPAPQATTILNSPELPKTPKDKDEFKETLTGTQDGTPITIQNKWFYNASENSWIYRGDSSVPIVVDDQNNGIITPEIFDKIQFISKMMLPNYFKIFPTQEAYYYYFRSSDRYITFTPEGDDVIRMEIDSGRLYSSLYRQICAGERGNQGAPGKQGPPGTTALPEITFQPKAINDELPIKVFAIAPLSLTGRVNLPNNHVPDMVVRIYTTNSIADIDDPLFYQKNYLPRYFLNDKVNITFVNTFLSYINRQELGLTDDIRPIAEILNPKNGSINKLVAEILVDPTKTKTNRITVYDDAIGILKQETLESFQLDETDCFLSGSVFFSSPKKSRGFAVKCMQQGPDGVQGPKGISCIEITENLLNGQNIVADRPVINVRYDVDSSTFYVFNAPITTTDQNTGIVSSSVCADTVALFGNNIILNDRDVFSSTFISAEVTLKQCKAVLTYQPRMKSYDPPELDLENWHPTSEIRTKRHWDKHSFRWADDASSKETSCSSPARTALQVVGQLAGTPGNDACCQEPFFYMPAIQDGSCPGDTVSPVIKSSS